MVSLLLLRRKFWNVAMDGLLSEQKHLAGCKLYMLSRQPFDVLSVDNYVAEIYVRSTGKRRRVPLTEIEPAWRTLRHKGELTRADIEERFSPRNPV